MTPQRPNGTVMMSSPVQVFRLIWRELQERCKFPQDLSIKWASRTFLCRTQHGGVDVQSLGDGLLHQPALASGLPQSGGKLQQIGHDVQWFAWDF
ncbi:hypothetical protein AQB9606_00301 [Aquabacterium sp. CECT 9606]|nr:hypothetical protein AQB9606_00301 [Aquabacterium sp. CECT 9606]